MADKVQIMRARVAEHLEQIATMFNHRPKITIIVRTPWLKDGGVVLTDDEFDLAIAVLNRLREEPIIDADGD